ncbi:ESX secretion-associated protein EspG [Nocardia stercoris]|uniref:ESX secretion-associated protein EspG n=1 Tax=Nocardia stercoris TaxID=2483361 RepID=A0A3M2L1L0_9NOCA|nr:ESX secretion-associated protein EspG [Nocardia stercoris]RMI30826.1 ESX secretion-associated protein EspG [Nocardia stercoris]
MKWVLAPAEFARVWTIETGMQRQPYPMNVAAAELPADLPATDGPRRHTRFADPELSAALALCSRPDSTVATVYGERRRTGTPERILAVGSVVGRNAAVLVANTDAVHVIGCQAKELASTLVEIIGSAPAGQHATMRQHQDSLLDPDVPVPDSGDRFRRLLRAPVDTRGVVTVTVAPGHPTTQTTSHRTWLDVRGDGRYLLTTAAAFTLAPVADQDFADHLDLLLGIR